jgi:hypothetical protein
MQVLLAAGLRSREKRLCISHEMTMPTDRNSKRPFRPAPPSLSRGPRPGGVSCAREQTLGARRRRASHH